VALCRHKRRKKERKKGRKGEERKGCGSGMGCHIYGSLEKGKENYEKTIPLGRFIPFSPFLFFSIPSNI